MKEGEGHKEKELLFPNLEKGISVFHNEKAE